MLNLHLIEYIWVIWNWSGFLFWVEYDFQIIKYLFSKYKFNSQAHFPGILGLLRSFFFHFSCIFHWNFIWLSLCFLRETNLIRTAATCLVFLICIIIIMSFFNNLSRLGYFCVRYCNYSKNPQFFTGFFEKWPEQFNLSSDSTDF